MATPASSGTGVLRHVRLTFTCISIVANALFAGGIFIFPLFSPALASHLKLTQPQLTTIVLAGMMGQYPFAAFVGKVIDHYGPWLCSLVSAVLFSSGFGFFSWEIAKTPNGITQPSSTSFHNLTFFFFLAGLGTVFSLFSSLFAASKTFPHYLGIASGASMALFGLSPLFLSVLASSFFTDPETGLNVTRFLKFHAIVAGFIHLIGAVTLKLPAVSEPTALSAVGDPEQATEPDERSALLPRKPPGDVDVLVPADQHSSTMDLLRDRNFWTLFLVSLVVLGSCEMVISNIGTIVLSHPISSSSSGINVLGVPSTDVATSTQVRILSLSNTVSRLLVGPVADFVSPVASYLPNGDRSYPRKHRISRIAFLVGPTILLASTYFWMELGIRSQATLWALSIGAGISYGITFTILPSLVSSIWGLSNLGRNFGIMTYAPFVGTPLFSYLYAFVSAGHTDSDQGSVCKGVECWQLTFWVGFAGALVALCGSAMLWRQWKGRV